MKKVPISNRQKKLENATESFNHWLGKNYTGDSTFTWQELNRLREQAKFERTTIHDYYRHHRSKIIGLRRRWKRTQQS